MNITESNKVTVAINTIVQGLTALSAALEEAAWERFEDHAGMPGVRPVAALRLAQPALVEATTEPGQELKQTDSQPAPVSEPVPEQVSLEQVRAVLAKLSQAGHTVKVRELIQATGADKLSNVPAEKYGWLLGQAEAIGDA
ncbi:hypothetical protein [Trueperella bialowiezensis]|uniref:rRNA biogenesis protein rrp5 n=1 Tax=Trueperella bialowiezensis TaxID=312285 RepID=A0A448PG39_9ACTO|nr:hypothetical protein [Trueperella bialowiezensis]VEI13878.1 Uncharacterised protein [Trueperella bialowiezensis]